MIPYPDPVLIEALAALPPVSDVGSRVSTVLDSALPAVRIVKVGDLEEPTTWEATPLYQIEVWGDDEAQTGALAWAIANHWPTARSETVGDARVHGRWVEVNPNPSHDEETGKARHILTIGIRLSGAPTS